MALDGSLSDSFTGEKVNRLFRSATKEHVITSYPMLVYRLKQNKLAVSIFSSVDSPEVVRANNPLALGESWVLLKSDFDRCKSVASKVTLDLFPTEPVNIILDRIRALLVVEFFP
jgi:hypothetical protein